MGSSPDVGSGPADPVAGGVFFPNIPPTVGVLDLTCEAEIGGETDEVERSLFIDAKSAEEEDGGLGVLPDRDLGGIRGPTHWRM